MEVTYKYYTTYVKYTCAGIYILQEYYFILYS